MDTDEKFTRRTIKPIEISKGLWMDRTPYRDDLIVEDNSKDIHSYLYYMKDGKYIQIK